MKHGGKMRDMMMIIHYRRRVDGKDEPYHTRRVLYPSVTIRMSPQRVVHTWNSSFAQAQYEYTTPVYERSRAVLWIRLNVVL